jgi:hypothetical protein
MNYTRYSVEPLKEAATLALDALEECQYATTSKADKMVDVAMNALRAALAESEPIGERAELIKNLRSNGEGCECAAYSSNECGCDVVWGSDYTRQAANMLEADGKLCAQTMRMEDAR